MTGIGCASRCGTRRRSIDFYGRILGLKTAGRSRFRCGDSLLMVRSRSGAVRAGEMRATGYRYLTVQVFDVDAEHARFLARGAEEGRPPVTLGTTARSLLHPRPRRQLDRGVAASITCRFSSALSASPTGSVA